MTAAAALVAMAVAVAWIAVPAPPLAPTRRRRHVRHRPGPRSAALLVGVLVAVAVPGAPWLAPPVAAIPLVHARMRRRRSSEAASAAVVDGLPDLLDLLVLAVGAGLTAPAAIEAAAPRAAGPVAAALRAAVARAADDGRLLADALADVPAALGAGADPARPLLAALADACRHGTALGPTLDRLGDEARTRRRLRAEARARKVPVLLLFPLVTCTLPALGLLTIAPIVVGSVRALRTT